MRFLCRDLIAEVRQTLKITLGRGLRVAVMIGLAVSILPAQDQATKQVPSFDLARQNMRQVAASVADIKAVLVKDDGGLMVELKRWIARDASNHGQLISDSDLTNDAIYNRLETDVRFRAVATIILQQYGYLVPQFNPNSDLGKEQDLLIQERVKWIAQQEEQERQQEQACLSGLQSQCPQQPWTTSLGQAAQQNSLNPQNGPYQQNPYNQQNPLNQQNQQNQQNPSIQQGAPGTFPNPNSPNGPSYPGQNPSPLSRAQLMETGGGAANYLSQLGLGNYSGGLQSGGSTTGASASSLLERLQSDQDQGSGTYSSFKGGGLNLQSALMGLSMNGAGLGGVFDQFDQNDINPYEMNQINRPAMFPQTSPNMSTPSANQMFFNQQNQQQAMLQPVGMVLTPSPYLDIPSLYDMYMQAEPHPITPERFGLDVFQNVSQDPSLIPMDLPAGPDYVVGPGDGLAIDLWGGVSNKIYRTVDRGGQISLPEVGPVLVSGKTLADVQENLQQVLRTQFRDESAAVSLARLRTIRVYVVGEVNNPGAYDISSLSTVLNALFVSGGPTYQGSLRLVKHLRDNQVIETVDVYDLLLRGVRTGMDRLDNGDSILVPPIGPQVTIEGMVRRPAVYELKNEKNLASVIELAGGLLPTAAVRHIEVQRLVAHQKETMLSLDIPDAGDLSDVTKKIEAFQVQDGDRIRIFPISASNEDAIYLEGHVLRPGRYSYKPEMRVTDVITSYKDLLPEPASQYAEIIRLNAPDFRPSVEGFNLADALADPSHAPLLKPMDTIQIFGKFEFENPPTVSILGDVRAPGTYLTSGQIRLSDAIHLASGLSPDAETKDAQVFRQLPDGKSEIFTVSLGLALQGDPTENIILEPRDRLIVHKSSNAVQPATVYVQGAVANPGRYPLTSNMTVADLIRLGGGLKPSADTQVGDLTRFQLVANKKITAVHEPLEISEALKDNPRANIPLNNGDVVTVPELAGWNDLGASITITGEVGRPGTYGIRPGDRLSSVLERAGGFEPDAYPYGAILERVDVRELQSKQQDMLILRLKDAQSSIQQLPATTPQQQQARDLALQQYQSTLTELTSNSPVGRVAIRISSDVKRWRNTTADIQVRAGDRLIIPKKPSAVLVTGSVFNPTAVSYRPGKSARWYLSQSGGPTQLANKKAIFVIRADGSVIGSKGGLFSGDPLATSLQPGDMVVVPERAIGGGVQWATLLTAAQVAASISSAIFIALRY